jgi:hypothetical protein
MLTSPHPFVRVDERAPAERHLPDREPAFDTVRFDVVGILLGDGTRSIVHIENAL